MLFNISIDWTERYEVSGEIHFLYNWRNYLDEILTKIKNLLLKRCLNSFSCFLTSNDVIQILAFWMVNQFKVLEFYYSTEFFACQH